MAINFDEEKQNSRIQELHNKEEEELSQILSARYGISYINLNEAGIDTNALRLISEERSRKAEIAAFDLNNKKVSLAVKSPNRQEVQNEIADLENRGYFIEPFLVSTKSLEKAWSRYADISFATESKIGALDISNEEIEKFISQVQSIEDGKNLIGEILEMKKSFRISRIVEIIVAAAIATKSSDIHIEPEEGRTLVRFRVDGVLIMITSFDFDTYKLLLSRIKLLSGMKINIKDNAQDGRFSVKIGKKEIEIRSSVLPGNYGESIVMRLLDPTSLTISIDDLGVPKYLKKIFEYAINKPNGMILNTGPTGSGKTTTLYSFLSQKRSPGIKIITIEDPIEYHLPGIVQTQVDEKKNYDFANGLKSSLRQDPDVIMVGEIRDLETAETAVHAALTGHLVFSTLHTNNAAGAFPRLIDLGVNSKILTSAITLVIAQRLARKLCSECKKETIMNEEELEIMKSIHESIPQELRPDFTNTIYKPVGCSHCNNTGYRGRIGIFEAVLNRGEELEDVINRNPSEREIKKIAQQDGMLDMSQDGLIKILKGITSFEEVSRVVDMVKREGKMEIEDPISQF